MDKELIEKINGVLHQYIIRNLDETILIGEKYITPQIHALVKEALPELAKEAGYFLEEAELVGRLLERGWIPPEEAKNYVKLAEDQTPPPIELRKLCWTATVNRIYKEANFRKVEVKDG